MGRPKTKTFSFAKGIYYMNINKAFRNSITIKRTDKKQALNAFAGYLKTQNNNCEWLGKWDGKKFIENDYEALVESI